VSSKDNVKISEQRISIDQLVAIDRITLNVSQFVIVTTEDKVRLCLDSYEKRSQNKFKWIAPAGILLTLILSLLTAEFNDFMFSSDTWKAIFVLLSVGAVVWLFWSVLMLRNCVTIEHLIDELKNGTNTADAKIEGGE